MTRSKNRFLWICHCLFDPLVEAAAFEEKGCLHLRIGEERSESGPPPPSKSAKIVTIRGESRIGRDITTTAESGGDADERK